MPLRAHAVFCLHAWTTTVEQGVQVSSLPVESSLLAACQAFDMLLPMFGYLKLLLGGNDLH